MNEGFSPNNPIQLPNVDVTENKFKIDDSECEKITGKLIGTIKDSIDAILLEAFKQGITLKTHLAYILGTAWHECRLIPQKEWGSDSYLKGKNYYPYFGRGFCQLTWDYNYKKEGERLGIDLLNKPDLALKVDIAANIIVHGMIKGSFTGKKLSDYITSAKTDFPNARRIINGTDKMELVASYASKFLKCII